MKTPSHPAGQEKEQARSRTGTHTPVYRWQRTSPCACSPPCSANQGRDHPSSRPSRSLQAHSHNRGKVLPIRVHPRCCFQPHKLFSAPIPSATTVPWSFAGPGSCARSKGPTTAAELPWGQGKNTGGTVPAQSTPLCGASPCKREANCNPQAQAANRSLGGQPKEFCSPETDSRQLFKTQPKGLTLCFPYSTSPQEVPKHCAFI